MWSNIIGQEKVKDILKNIFLSGKISHAYIFYGDEGVGKDAAAVEFAKLLNCDDPVNGNEACDKCKSCIEIDSFRSSLIKFVTALPSGKNESDDDKSPLEKLDKEDFAILSGGNGCKNQMTSIIKFPFLKPTTSGSPVFVR